MTNFKGSLSECIKHFARRIKGDFEFRRRVCNALSIDTGTAHRWFDQGGALPKGVNLLKFYLLLELNGYQVAEWQKIDGQIREYGKLLAMGIIKLEDAVSALRFSDPHGVLRVVLGKVGTTENKLAEIQAALTELHESGQQKLLEWSKEVVFMEDNTAVKPTASPAPSANEAKGSFATGISHEQALRIFAHQVQAMIPFAEWIASNQFTREERRRLRELSANGRSNNVFELSTALNRLCSETARKEL